MPVKVKTDAIALLKADHKKVKELFDAFEEAEEQDEKNDIAKQATTELKIHAVIEEEIFYPALRQKTKGDEDDQELLDEADEEHRVAKTLVEEIEAELEKGSTDEHFNAKFTVLAENVRHHIKEEEGEMFKSAKKADMEKLGEELMARKEELMANDEALEEAVSAAKIRPYQELGA